MGALELQSTLLGHTQAPSNTPPRPHVHRFAASPCCHVSCAPGGATLGALELQASLREAQADVARLRGEVLALGAEAEAGARERAGLQGALEEARSRWGTEGKGGGGSGT